jgi:hypothetical protein
MNHLSKEQLEKLPTHRLLAYKRKLNKDYYYTSGDDRWDGNSATPEEIERNNAMSDILSVLHHREHVVRASRKECPYIKIPTTPQPDVIKKGYKSR